MELLLKDTEHHMTVTVLPAMQLLSILMQHLAMTMFHMNLYTMLLLMMFLMVCHMMFLMPVLMVVLMVFLMSQ